MVRIITQVLVGLMLFFGAVTLLRRCIFYLKERRALKAFYFFILFSTALFLALLAFQFAYTGISEVSH